MKANVKSYVNYYHLRKGFSTIRILDAAGHVTADGERYGINLPFGSTTYTGSIMQSDAPKQDMRVDTEMANVMREGDIKWAGNGTPKSALGRLYGNDVNHETMPWFLRYSVEDELRK